MVLHSILTLSHYQSEDNVISICILNDMVSFVQPYSLLAICLATTRLFEMVGSPRGSLKTSAADDSSGDSSPAQSISEESIKQELR